MIKDKECVLKQTLKKIRRQRQGSGSTDKPVLLGAFCLFFFGGMVWVSVLCQAEGGGPATYLALGFLEKLS